MHWIISNGKAEMHAVLAECIKYIVKGVMEQWDMAVVVKGGGGIMPG